MDQSTEILKKSGLSITEGRKIILDLFLAAQGALAHADIEKNKNLQFDDKVHDQHVANNVANNGALTGLAGYSVSIVVQRQEIGLL